MREARRQEAFEVRHHQKGLGGGEGYRAVGWAPRQVLQIHRLAGEQHGCRVEGLLGLSRRDSGDILFPKEVGSIERKRSPSQKVLVGA